MELDLFVALLPSPSSNIEAWAIWQVTPFRFAPAFKALGCVNIADYVMIIISTRSATRFQLSDFELNDFKISDHLPKTFGLKTFSQVTKFNNPNDFRSHGIKPSDHLS